MINSSNEIEQYIKNKEREIKSRFWRHLNNDELNSLINKNISDEELKQAVKLATQVTEKHLMIQVAVLKNQIPKIINFLQNKIDLYDQL
jgi:hypothetical protein